MRCSILVVSVFAALALTGCGASSGGQSSAAGSSAHSASTSRSPADVQVCKGLAAYPKITTVAGSRKYAAWLSRQAAVTGVSLVLSEDLKAAGADLTDYLKGTISQSQVGADADKLQAVCGAYGVS
jgi:hypothetical protein